MITIPSTNYNYDERVRDAAQYVADEYPELLPEFAAKFPQWGELVWDEWGLDYEKSDIDPEYMSWVTDWIEANTPIFWWEGEPILLEDDDDPEWWV